MKKTSFKNDFVLIPFLFLLIFLLYSVITNAAPQAVHADNYNKGVNVSPSNIKFHVEPGKTEKKTIKVSNFTGRRQKFKINFF